MFLLTAVMASNSFGFTYGSLEFIGFSKDGRYLAFENTNGGGDGGGGTQTTYFIDTAKNSYAMAPIVLDINEEKPARFRAALRLYEQKLVPTGMRKFGIVRGNTGGLVVSHLLSDWSNITPVERTDVSYFTDGTKNDGPVTDYQGALGRRYKSGFEKVIFNGEYDSYRQNTYEFYELTLTTSPAGGGNDEDASNFKIELTLQDKTKHPNAKPQILQKDGDVLTNFRAYAYGYRIESVYIYGDRIAVFINVFGQGFEETDMNYMVVTGKIAGY